MSRLGLTDPNSLAARCGLQVEVIPTRDDNIPLMVMRTGGRIGIVGLDVLGETNLKNQAAMQALVTRKDLYDTPPAIPEPKVLFNLGSTIGRLLGFETRCRLMLGVPEERVAEPWQDVVRGGSVFTSFPYITQPFMKKEGLNAVIIGATEYASCGYEVERYLRDNRLDVAIETKAGDVESSCRLDGARAVTDLTVSGRTMQNEGLCPVKEVMQAPPVIIRRRGEKGTTSPVLRDLRDRLADLRRATAIGEPSLALA